MFNFNLISLTLFLVSIFIAYIALTGGLAAKNLLLIWLIIMLLMCLSSLYVYGSILSDVWTIPGPINWLDITNPYPQAVLANVCICLIIGAFSLVGVLYLIQSPVVKAFYANR
jgi:hypothetical protein